MPNKHIISKYLGKVKIDEIFQHTNNNSSKGPDGINIRGNMYIDDNLGIGTEYIKNSKLNIVGNISISESNLNNGNILDVKNINGNTILSIQNNNIGVNTKNPLTELHIIGTNGLIIPIGTNDNRPSEHKGLIRFNESINSFEGCDGNYWLSLNNVTDVDKNTYITAEDSANSDNNQLKFITENVQRMIIGNSSQNGNVGIGIEEPLSTLHISGNDGLIIPYGNTDDDRPNAISSHKGMLRFNTQINSFEGCDGNYWNSLGGVIDVDQNTYITAEDSANSDNNQLKFITENVQRMIIGNSSQNGNVGIGIEEPLSTLHVGGNINCNYLLGNVIGNVSSISNHNTDDLEEGTTNKYFTNIRVRDAINIIESTRINYIENQIININNNLYSLNEERVINIENDVISSVNIINTLVGESTINSIPNIVNLNTHDGRISNIEILLISTTNKLYTLVGLDIINNIPVIIDLSLTTGLITNIEKHIITIKNIIKSLTEEPVINNEKHITTIKNNLYSLNEERVINIENDVISSVNIINTLVGESTINSIPNIVNLNTHDGRISNIEILLISTTNKLYTLVGLDIINNIPVIIDLSLTTGLITNIEKHIITIKNIIKSLTE